MYVPSGVEVHIAQAATAQALHIYDGGVVRWMAQADLSIVGNGTVVLESGAVLESAAAGSTLRLGSMGQYQLVVSQAAAPIQIDNVLVGGGATLTTTGSGTLQINQELVLGTEAQLINELTGQLRVGGDLTATGASSSIVNAGSLLVEGNLLLNVASETEINNQGTLVVQGDFSASHSHHVLVENQAAAILEIGGDLELNSNCNHFLVQNHGLVHVADDLKESPTSGNNARLYNFENATLKLGQNSPDNSWQLFANFAGSTVEYNRQGNQLHIFIPQDAYHNLTLSGIGTKRTVGQLLVNGDLRIAEQAQLDVDAHNDDVILRGSWYNTSTHLMPFNYGRQIVAFIGEGFQTVNGNPNQPFYSLKLNKSGGMVVLNTAAVIVPEGNLMMQRGVLHTSMQHLLTISSTATASNGNARSFVDGPLLKEGSEAFTFPLGDGLMWAPIGMDGFEQQGEGRVLAEFSAELAPENTNHSMDVTTVGLSGFWQLEAADAIAPTQVALHWTALQATGAPSVGDLVVAQRTNEASIWQNRSGELTTDGSKGSIATSVASLGSFALASNSGFMPLPIELTDFSATVKGNLVALDWHTASEHNNAFFTVERSADGRVFEPVVTREGAGTTSAATSYTAIDAQPLAGISYYRLRQTDLNGTSTTSDIVAVQLDVPITSESLGVFPNPVAPGGSVTIRFGDVAVETTAEVTISDLSGRTMEKTTVAAGWQPQVQLSTQALPTGVYLVAVTVNNHTATSRLVVGR